MCPTGRDTDGSPIARSLLTLQAYNTGEPHPLDDDSTLLDSYVDPATRWTMYRYKKDVVQPEDGKSGYINAAEAVAQRDRWRADELAAAEYERTREHYADEMFPEPPPVHPDDDPSCSE
eukprot:3593105-Pleurochrysis_carterae.AAC.1